MARRRPTGVLRYPSDADGTSEVAGRARGQKGLEQIFLDQEQIQLWKIGREAQGRYLKPEKDVLPVGFLSLMRCALYNVAMAPTLRDFQSEDFESLWRMDQECFPPGISYSKEELKAYMMYRGSFTLVAADEKDIQGFIVAKSGAIGHIITIDVGPAARRSGIGSLLLKGAEEKLRASGSLAAGLEAAVDNTAALSFYKRHGYAVIRTWPRYYSNGVDALVLRKALK